MRTDVLVIGSGLAGCAAALAAAKRGAAVTIITKKQAAEESNTFYAQGGIIYRGAGDSQEALAKDIMEAGAGLCLPEAVELVSREGPRLCKEILIDELHVPFDEGEDEEGEFHLTAEAAHSVPRILHHRDFTGQAIERAMIRALGGHPNVAVLTNMTAIDLLTLSHHSLIPQDIYRSPTCAGAYVLDQSSGEVAPILAKETVIAAGGLGAIFLHTTNPPGARGDGIAMAYRAGARCVNLHYVQFHPTTLYHPSGRFLISEALRGEGARLIDSRGREFMKEYHPAGSLAPRDVVARGIHQMMLDTGAPCAHLDISDKPADWVRSRFPAIHARCLGLGIDMTKEPIPVVPAAHYSCGGIAVDGWGRSNVERLYAVGEVACTGVHGANRLASASLLECLVWGTRAGDHAARRVRGGAAYDFPEIAPWRYEHEPADPALIAQDWLTIRHTMWNYVGLVRSSKRLDRAHEILRELQIEIERFYKRAEMTDAMIGLRNGVQTALAVLLAATEARESRGCHYHAD